MSQLLIVLFQLANNVEINYACIDQHVDATFKTVEEANAYADYFKPHHHYQVIPFIKFNEKES